jgi:3-deoxy-D-manno-octulosonic-acid transferase
LLARGEYIVTTHATPAGRRAAYKLFPQAIADGRMVVRYVPIELGFAFRRFLRRCRPRLALVMEVELWPVLIMEARRAGVPLFLCNSQYPEKSYDRDRSGRTLRALVLHHVTGVLAKSETHAARFRALGAPDIHITGELRFEQDIPTAQITAARALRPHLQDRPVVTFASVVKGETPLYLEACRILQDKAAETGRPRPFFIHVTRAPELFSADFETLQNAGQNVVRRSRVLDDGLAPRPDTDWQAVDILVGDSLGEMNFFQALADIVSVGGAFSPQGSHNICEPVALGKPVINGPVIWPIEYPAVEALAEGALHLVQNPQELANAIDALLENPAELARRKQAAEAFLAKHSGAVDKTLAVIEPALKGDTAT